MKVFLICALLVALVAAEPPAYRQQYYFAQQKEEVTPEASAPYPSSGWKPDGPAFNLPQRQGVENAYGPPTQQYGPPTQQYGPPTQQYGPPKKQYGPPAAPQNQYGPPSAPQNQYGPPATPQNQYGPSAPPQNQYGAPADPRKQFATTKQQFGQQTSPQNQYGAPAAPQQEFGPSQQQYGPPAAPQNQYGAPAAPQQQFASPQQQFGASQQFGTTQNFRGGPAPQNQFNVPQNPQQQYGPPEYTTTEVSDTTDGDEPTTVRGLTESESEPVNSVNELDEEGDVDKQQKKSGQYFVALPDGRLQRVRYMSREDIEAMKYFAKIRAENVEPLRGPIYTYAPLQKLQISPASLQVAVAAPVPVDSSKPERLTTPNVEIQPLAQVQYQLDSPGNVGPLSSSYSSYTANYRVPAPVEQRYIVSV